MSGLVVMLSLCGLVASIASGQPWGWWLGIAWLAVFLWVFEAFEAAPFVDEDGEWL